MGGGAGMMGMPSVLPDKDACQRRDGRELAKGWLRNNPGSELVTNMKELMAVDIANTSKIMGIFADDHLPYATVKPDTVPSLANMTLQAIRMLRKNKKGFFLMVSVTQFSFSGVYLNSIFLEGPNLFMRFFFIRSIFNV